MLLRTFFILSIFFIYSVLLSAQKTYDIKGALTDVETSPLIAASVVLLNKADSSFASYGFSSDEGKFRLEAKRDEDYILQISYLGFNPIIINIKLDKNYDYKTLVMEESKNMLESVQIVAEYIPIRMKGDTLEFNSAAFNVQAHDDVEKLLEQMPGVEIDENGTVKINGKKVEKILVDGKEFFGENVQAALKSLPADAIDKIKVYDKKTDAEELTGSESETETKTIDLTLKEDKKVGYMGNIEGGYGYPNNRYKGSLSLNYFNPKMRISLIGASNNINEAGFSYKDYNGMTGGYNNFMRGNSAMSIGGNWDDPIANLLWGDNSGETRAISGGINTNFFISENTDLSFHYMYTNADKRVTINSFNRVITPENFYTRNSNNNNFLLAQRHIFNTKLTHKIDSTHEFRFRFKFSLTKSEDETKNEEETLASNDSLENDISQILNQNKNGTGLISNLYYQKKLKKKRRTISANIAAAYVYKNKYYNNYSNTNLYNNNGTLAQIDTLSQNQYNVNNKQVYGAQVNYTEPLGEKNLLEFKLLGGFSIEGNDRSAFDLYEAVQIINDSITDNYRKHYNFQKFCVEFKRDVEKYKINTSIGVQRSALTGVLASASTIVEQQYYYPLVNLRFKYKFTKNKSASLSYRTRVREPHLNQLQPMVNNQNPLSLSIGNPNLAPSYNHNIWLNYRLWDQSTFTSYNISAYANITQNTIINSRTIDETFRTIYQPVNNGTSYRGGVYLGYNGEIKKVIKFNIRANAGIHQTPVLINEITSRQFTQSYGAYLHLGNKKKKIIDLSLSARVDIGNSVYSGNSELNLPFINHSYTGKFRLTIAKKWNIATNFNFDIYESLGYDEAIAIPIWSASINRTFFKGDQLKIELSAQNILNESFLVKRYNWGGVVSETKTNMLGRYFMLSLAYKINKTGGTGEAEEDVIIF